MEAIILVGIQGSGKTTFYRERFFDTHVRISLDLFRTRERERLFIQTCLVAKQPYVVDNTNVLAAERAPYITAARAAGFRVIAYFVRTELRAALGRNRKRAGKQAIPVPGVLRTYKRLQPPTAAEGFDAVYLVELTPENQFVVTDAALS